MDPNPMIERYTVGRSQLAAKPKERFTPGKFTKPELYHEDGDVAWAWAAGALEACPGAVAWVFGHAPEKHSGWRVFVCIVPPEGVRMGTDGLGLARRFSL